MYAPELQRRVDALCARDSEAKQIIQLIESHFDGHKTTVSADTVLKDAEVYENMSMLLPERRKVKFALRKAGIAVTIGDKILSEGSWAEYTLALCLPLPDRPKPTWNLVLTGTQGDGPWMLFTLPDAAADKFKEGAKPVSIREALLSSLRPHVEAVIDKPIAEVGAHLGSKEGLLVLLPEYIFFGYRKPLLLIPHSTIRSISYTVITRSTFNVVISTVSGQQHEFGMILHEFYDLVNNYVLKYGISDESLAEERRAKRMKTEEAEALPDIDADPSSAPPPPPGPASSDSEEVQLSDNEDDSDSENEQASDRESGDDQDSDRGEDIDEAEESGEDEESGEESGDEAEESDS